LPRCISVGDTVEGGGGAWTSRPQSIVFGERHGGPAECPLRGPQGEVPVGDAVAFAVRLAPAAGVWRPFQLGTLVVGRRSRRSPDGPSWRPRRGMNGRAHP